VIFVTFVVKCLFLLWLQLRRAEIFVVKTALASADVITHLPHPMNNLGY
jgi:hypothetical protein